MSKIGSFEFRLENFIKKVSFSDDFDVTDKLSVVGVLFRLTNNSPELLIIKRSNNLRTHPGEWAFPGGKIDADDNDYEDTVLREINEELGIQSFNIKLLGRIKHFVTSSGFIVIPYLGVLKNGYSIDINLDEVEKYFFVDFNLFFNSDNFRTISFLRSDNNDNNFVLLRTLSFAHKDKVIWGATARIIRYITNKNNNYNE